MKSVQSLLTELKSRDIKLWIEDDRLRYKAPEGALDSTLLEQLRNQKTEIFTFLQSLQADSAVASGPEIKPRAQQKVCPFSFAQRRLWFLDQLEGQSATYNIPRALELSGPLDVSALEQAIAAILRRHEVLRSRFQIVAGEPVQWITPSGDFALPIVDLQALPESNRREEVMRLSEAAAHAPFNLNGDALIRCQLLKLGAASHVLLVTMHHIVSDGWSMGIFSHELSTFYSDHLKGLPPSLPVLPIQYADFAEWQSQWLQGAELERQMGYWRQQLAGAPALLELPTDRPRPAVQAARGSTVEFELDAPLSQLLKELSQRSGTTLFMTLLAAFSVLLSRYSGSEDIVIGSPIANRNRQEIEPLIGFFANTLLSRTKLEGNPSFSELLQRVRQGALDAYAHQDMPFEKLVEELNPERNLSYHPLFQVMFALQNAPSAPLELPGLSVRHLPLEETTAKFDLTLSMWESGQGLAGSWEYNCDLFDAATIQRMSEHFQVLLAGIVANPEQSIAELPLLSESERHQLLVEWNDTRRDYAQDKCIHQLFEEQVERRPDALAVVFEGQQLSYGELNARANQLAHYLQSLGVGPEVLVGLCVERSVEMVVGVLGVLKAGGAYVPLDPNYPSERLAFMLCDTEISVLLGQESCVERLPELSVPTVCLERDWDEIAQHNADNPVMGLTPSNLAYVIYTSGSTGKPKGVMVQHDSLVNFIQSAISDYQLGAADRMLQFASISFDVAAEEIYGCLVAGGTLVLRTDAMLSSVTQFLQTCGDWQLSVMDVPTAYWQQIVVELAQGRVALPRSLRLLLIGGERVSPESVKLWQAQVGDYPQLINAYGPTEATVSATSFQVSASRLIANEVPIGQALANVQTYVLDQQLRPVPVGVPGELYVGGRGVARGYLNRAELTAERFIADPFSDVLDARLYKTGDCVRYLADGNLEFLGRIDDQVQIRGFRVELGEIETVLVQHAQIREVVVVVREDALGDKRLVAYLVPQSASVPSGSDLRQYVKQQLPDYMVPSVFVVLDALPLTPNGKVDRRGLPAPDPSERVIAHAFVAPRSANEVVLSQIWGEVLRLEQVGIHDNFFELGGHSLLATQVISRIREALQVELPLAHIFEAPTIAELTVKISRLNSSASAGSSAEPTIPRLTDRNAVPLSFAQQRLWFVEQLKPNSAAFNLSTALRLIGDLDMAALQQTLDTIFERHEALRTNFREIEGEPVQVVTASKALPLLLVDAQSVTNWAGSSASADETQEDRLQQFLQQQAYQPFDLVTDDLLRVILVRLAAEHVLLLTMHHIVSDGWSMEVLNRELTVLYTAFAQGHPSPLPSLPVQYLDFASWQREWLTGDVLEAQVNYWRQNLQGAPPLLHLPTDRPRPAVQTFVGRSENFSIDRPLADALKTLTQRTGTTLYMLLLSAFATLLSRYSGQEDIMVGSPIANRNHREVEPLMGFFVNTLVMRTRLQGNPTFAELLEQVKKSALDAYAHQDVPFEYLATSLRPERDPSHSLWFQVFFAWQNAPTEPLGLPGLSVSSVDIESQTARFDLSMDMYETASGMEGWLSYNTDLFDQATVLRMLGHFQMLLASVADDPQQRVSAIPLLTFPEREQLLTDWAGIVQPVLHTPQLLHQCFEEQVRKSPDHIALAWEDPANPGKVKSLTYVELNARANQLAHYLRTLGVSADSLVGLCVERSTWMVIGLLGVLKAGGAYVPLDPRYPSERLAMMIADAQPSVLLTQESCFDALPPSDVPTICLARDWAMIASQAAHNPVSETRPENLAYVIYTSGSTGKPKGVMVQHDSLVNFTQSAVTGYGISERDRVLQFASMSFDAAAEEIYPCLVSGGTLVLRTDDMLSSVERFLRTCREWQITVLDLPTAYWQQVVMELGSSELRLPGSLQLVIIGGERVSPEHVKIWQSAVGELPRLINTYGPTEGTVVATAFSILSDTPICGEVPIGRGIANVQTYVLDEQLQPLPVGVPGQLYIGGQCLARGYLHRAELTAERFIADPFSDLSEARLYKTGDCVRYLADGNLEFLGRIDDQVKIRGFRVELGEIEARLVQHAQIREVVVVVREDEPGDKRLVAYVVPQSESAPSGSDLRQYVKQQLPDYMVPSAFVVLAALPLTPSGKVDRRGLPAPDPSERAVANEFVAPSTEIEERLSHIWRELLKQEQVGIHDNFFELGGHSLMAVQLFAEIEKTFGKKLPLATLFQAATISAMAEVLRQKNWLAPWSSLVAIKPDGSKPPLFYLHPFGGNVLVYRDLALSLGDDRPMYGLQPRGLDGKIQPSNSIEEMAEFYLAQIRKVQPEGPYHFVGLSMGGTIAWEMACQLQERGESVGLLGLLDTAGPEYPQLLPLLPRLGSVLNWMGIDTIQRLLQQPSKLFEVVKTQGWRPTGRVLLEKLKLVKPFQDDDAKFEESLFHERVNKGLEDYANQLNQVNQVEVKINRLITFLLSKSSCHFYAHTFTSALALEHNSKEIAAVSAANSEASKNYQERPFAGTVTLFRATDQPPGIVRDPYVGWKGFAVGEMKIYDIPGHHQSIMDSPVLAQRLKDCLDSPQTATPNRSLRPSSH